MDNLPLPHSHGTANDQILKNLPTEEKASAIAEAFKLISDSTRLRILCLLCHCEECVNNIASVVDMSAPAISHHLRVLKQAGLIKARRDGKEVYYTLANNAYAETIHQTVDTVFGCKCSSCKSSRSGCGENCRNSDE